MKMNKWIILLILQVCFTSSFAGVWLTCPKYPDDFTQDSQGNITLTNNLLGWKVKDHGWLEKQMKSLIVGIWGDNYQLSADDYLVVQITPNYGTGNYTIECSYRLGKCTAGDYDIETEGPVDLDKLSVDKFYHEGDSGRYICGGSYTPDEYVSNPEGCKWMWKGNESTIP